MSKVEDFLTTEQEQSIVQTIKTAEKNDVNLSILSSVSQNQL